MKVFFALFMLLYLSLISCSTVSPLLGGGAQALKKRIAVLEFEDKTEHGKGKLSEIVTDILITELVGSERFIVVERTKIKKILKEQKTSVSGIVDPATAVEIGRLMGVNAVVIGSVSEFGIRKAKTGIPGFRREKEILQAVVDIRLVDVQTGVILVAESGRGETSISKTSMLKMINVETSLDETMTGTVIREAMASFVKKMKSKMEEQPWQGFILKVGKDQVVITSGKDADLKKEMVFEVLGAGGEEISPTGQRFHVPGEKKGEIMAVDIQLEITTAKILSGSGFVKGDIVRVK